MSTLARTSANDDAMELWHKRLGHLNAKWVKALQNMVSGMDLGKVPSNVVPFACEGCVEGKQARQPIPSDGGTRATKVLELVHSDVCRPMRTTSMGGGRYFLTFIDDFSRKLWVYVLKSKRERCLRNLWNRRPWWKGNRSTRSRCLGLLMVRSTRLGDLMSSYTSIALQGTHQPPTSHNKMGWPNVQTAPLWRWQGP